MKTTKTEPKIKKNSSVINSSYYCNKNISFVNQYSKYC